MGSCGRKGGKGDDGRGGGRGTRGTRIRGEAVDEVLGSKGLSLRV